MTEVGVMCLACEQGDLESRWEMIEIISQGRLPEGHTAEDLRAMGLPVPGELYRETQGLMRGFLG